MDIEVYKGFETEDLIAPAHVPAAVVRAAVADARSPVPAGVHRSVALAVARGSEKTARLRLERLARVVMSTGQVDSPEAAWAADWGELPSAAYESLDRSIGTTWGAASTRNAMRDSVRAVVRACRDTGLMTHDAATAALSALRPEQIGRDEEKQARGHLSTETVTAAFVAMATDESPTARRDAALIALLVGAGLRREEAAALDLADLDAARETLVVTGKGAVVRSVPLAPGVRRAVSAWLDMRGEDDGPLLTPMSKTVPRVAETGRRLSVNAVAAAVKRRFAGEDEAVRPHDLRRTFVGDLLDAGADLSSVSKIVGHTSPSTTAGYDRRGIEARRAAVERLSVPFV
ncbi:tyrosine-type recombinase/integrase [Gordonia sp. MP11Mi]|uniref:Tyrosine recombinase XerC n=1 Tax=Gordonia sp. MP11Mi TaxID=3022769 RepID=A0AA97CZD4_9ACTN